MGDLYKENLDETDALLPKPVLIRKQSNRNLYVYTIFMLFGALCTGLMLGMSSPLIPGLENDTSSRRINITKRDASWIGSVLNLGGIAGGALGGFQLQTLGRKATAITSGIPYIAGLLLIAFAENVWMIYAGRLVTGVAMSITTLVVPTYVSEISTDGLRGFLCSGNQLFITIGIFVVYGFGGILTWRWLAIAAGAFPLLFCFCVLFVPESPRFLLLKNRVEKATESLQKLRGKGVDVSSEIHELQDSIESSPESATWMQIFREQQLRVPFLISMAIMFFQQFSGINSVMFYLKSIFQDAGFDSPSEQTALLLVSGIQIVFTAISCGLVDRLGRKVLLSVSGIFMAASMGVFGAYFLLLEDEKRGEFSWMALSSVIIYISTFALGFGPVPFILMSELVPLRARGRCGGVIIAFNLLCSFVVTSEFYDMQAAMTTQGTFWLYGGISLLGVAFTIFVIPETKGHSLEEIERHYRRRDSVYQPIGAPYRYNR